MECPHIAKKGSYLLELSKDQTYLFCTCGHSKDQPFCDQKGHKATSFKPLAFKPDKNGRYYVCGCKHAKTLPYCDGTHKSL